MRLAAGRGFAQETVEEHMKTVKYGVVAAIHLLVGLMLSLGVWAQSDEDHHI